MGWVTERLAGTINGSNKTFTVTHDPVDMSIVVIFGGLPFEKVMGSPTGNQYSRSGVNITLGLAPQTGQDPPPFARYFWDAG